MGRDETIGVTMQSVAEPPRPVPGRRVGTRSRADDVVSGIKWHRIPVAEAGDRWDGWQLSVEHGFAQLCRFKLPIEKKITPSD